MTDIWNSVIEGFGGAFLLIIEAAADILVLAGAAAGKALLDEVKKIVPANFPFIGKTKGISSLDNPEGRALLRELTGPTGRARGAGKGLSNDIEARLKRLTSTLAILAKQQTRGLGARSADEFGNLVTQGQARLVEDNKKAAKAGTDLISRLLGQIGAQTKKAAGPGQGAFAAVGFAALQKHMQSIISKGEEAAIKLAEKAERDRGKQIGLLEDIGAKMQPAGVGP